MCTLETKVFVDVTTSKKKKQKKKNVLKNFHKRLKVFVARTSKSRGFI